MSIPSQFPQAVATARGSALQALALQAGQVIEAKVIGPAPGGGTQVEIAGQRLNLLMPALLAAGTTIKLEVQQAGAQLRLAMQLPTTTQSPSQPATTAQAPPALPGPPTPSPQMPLPAQALAAAPQPLPTATPAGSTAPPQIPTPVTSNPAVPSLTQPAPSIAVAVQATPATPPQAPVPPTPANPAPPAPGQATATATPQPLPAGQPVAAVQGPTAPSPTANPAPPAAGPAAQPSAVAPPVTQRVSAPQPAAATTTPAPTPAPSTPAAPAPSLPLAAVPQPLTPSGPATAPAPTVAAPPSTPPQPQAQSQAQPTTPVPTPALTAPFAAYAKAPPVSQPAPSAQGAAQPSAAPPSMPSTPQAAVTHMVQAALPRQDSIAALTAVLSAVVGKVALPEPVLKAVRQVLSGQTRLDAGKIDGATIQRAVLNSGLFQEARIATGSPAAAPGDMKTALLSLRSALGAWLGDQAPVQQVNRPPPPLRGAAPRVLPTEPPQLPAATPQEAGHKMLDHAEAALSRLRLHQAASLPDPVDPRRADWSIDLPVVIGTHQTTLGIQIHRDPEDSGKAAPERGWSLRFALNLPETGEVGAQVSLRGASTGVMLWSADPETAEALRQGVDELRHDLAAAGLKPGAVIVRQGEPAATTPTAQSGHLLDTSQ